MGNRRTFGALRKLPSGRWQASYIGPDRARHAAPHTYGAKDDAEAWLQQRRREIERGDWKSPTAAKPVLFSEFAERWLERRNLKPRTRAHYRSLLDAVILPTFGPVALKHVTTDLVDDWYHRLGDKTPTKRAHAYGLLRSIMKDAEQRRLVSFNPVNIHGAGSSKRQRKVRPASVEELATIAENMPDRLRLMVLLAGWCALRFGELAELRRGDVDLARGVLHVRRGVVRVGGEKIIGDPKSAAGIRDVNIPPHLLPMVKDHLSADITGGRDGLLFPGKTGDHLATSSLYGKIEKRNRKTGKITQSGWGFYHARQVAGRPDLRFHDLRHTGATLAAATGATLAELMARLGHSTVGAALKYQHAAQDRDKAIAAALSKIANGES